MKRMLMAVLAVAVAVTFSAPAFAGDDKGKKEGDKKSGGKLVQMLNADEKPKDDKKKTETKK